MAKQKMEYECVCGQRFLTETGRNSHQKKCKMAKSFAEEEKEQDRLPKIAEVNLELSSLQTIVEEFESLSDAGKHWVRSWFSNN